MAVVFDVPMQVVFGELLVGQSTNLTLTVKRLDGKPLNLSKAESSDPNVTATVVPGSDPTNTTADVKLTVKGTGGPRQIYSNVSFFTEGQQFPVARTMVYGQVVTEFRIMPEQIFWGIADPKNWPGQRNVEQMNSRTVRLEMKKSGGSFTIRSIKTDIKDLTLTVVTEQTGRVYQVVARLAKAPEASERGTIIVETDWADRPTITIPVSINVLSRSAVSLPVSAR